MDELTLKNLEFLEKIGYFYEAESDKFWSTNHEHYVDLRVMHCNDLVRVMNVIIKFEQELAFDYGKDSAQIDMRRAIGILD